MRRFAVLLAMLFAIPAFAQTIAIRAGNVIDPATGKVAQNQIILVKTPLQDSVTGLVKLIR